MKLLGSPVVVILLGVLAGSATGLWWFWKNAHALVTASQVHKVEQIEASRPEKPWDFWTPEVENLSQELSEAKTALAKREAEVAIREVRVKDEAAELDKVRLQVESLRTDINSRILQVQEQEMKNLKTLSTTYSLLTPKAAVAIFSQLDDITVTKLLSLMKPEITAAILEEMSSTPGENDANLKRVAAISNRLRLLLPAQKKS